MNAPTFDRRTTPARQALAAEYLRGQVTAEAYAVGRPMRIVAPYAPLRRDPRPDIGIDTQALRGESVTLYDANEEGWSWVQLAADHYVGWVPSEALGGPGKEPTHRVQVLRTFVYPGPSIKQPTDELLSLGSRVHVRDVKGNFAELERGGYIYAPHLAPITQHESDFVAVAERFFNTPYLWGGKTSFGLDCSGLVQVSLQAAGVFAPRDSDMQERELGQEIIGNDDLSGLQRGDLIFWKGHVGIMRDATTLLHANGYHMLVASEPLREAVDRILAAGEGPIRRIKRL
ncbi:C40 family peptidase [Methylovirgula sp. 4M-Z18]|uniref:C40 family peptidase n=1 Tax=Methylovirgula sp. 4M-Z18 TaxID=2293567 RepID=UPI000E2F08CD|nr:C40 family peptidase [Methylovirgula sp. 4M-Z18]RFB79004.1 peptidase P60 [Methylovirgula sp. 4M-Z18]